MGVIQRRKREENFHGWRNGAGAPTLTGRAGSSHTSSVRRALLGWTTAVEVGLLFEVVTHSEGQPLLEVGCKDLETDG